MLKVGGKLSYSTCSLNPIENEAVVASALKKFEGYIELEKVELPGFKFREGLTNWHVMMEKADPKEGESSFIEYHNMEEVPLDKAKKAKTSMFINQYSENTLKELTKCLRVFPHDQNTSGFFITIIRKIKDFDADLD